MKSDSIFGKHQLAAGEAIKFQLSQLNVELIRTNEGWEVRYSDETKSDGNTEYYQTGKSNTLIIQPALPEKPLIFKGNQLFVSPKQKLTFFIKIPLNVQLCYSKGSLDNVFKEFSWKRLSDSWFGEPDFGEPAFSIGNEYFLKFDDIKTNDFEAICPVTVFNNSPIPLELQRLIIRTDNLALYQNSDKIVCTLVEIEYKGKDVVSSADYHFSKIYNGEKQVVITKPRNESSKSMLKINFHFIKNIWSNEF